MVALHGCERFGVSWHSASGLPLALRILLVSMSGIHLGTVKCNIPDFFLHEPCPGKNVRFQVKGKKKMLLSRVMGLHKALPQLLAAPVLYLDPLPGPGGIACKQKRMQLPKVLFQFSVTPYF